MDDMQKMCNLLREIYTAAVVVAYQEERKKEGIFMESFDDKLESELDWIRHGLRMMAKREYQKYEEEKYKL